MSTAGRTFEIYYSQGGHCGPYSSVQEAIEDGVRKLRGCPNEKRIVVRDRAISDPRKATVLVLEKQDDGYQVVVHEV